MIVFASLLWLINSPFDKSFSVSIIFIFLLTKLLMKLNQWTPSRKFGFDDLLQGGQRNSQLHLWALLVSIDFFAALNGFVLWLWYWCLLHALHAWTNWKKNTKVCSLLFKELSWIGSDIQRFAFIKIARSSAQWFNGLIRGEDEITCWTTRKKKGSAKPTCYHYDHSSAILKYHHSRDFFPPLPRRRILKLI